MAIKVQYAHKDWLSMGGRGKRQGSQVSSSKGASRVKVLGLCSGPSPRMLPLKNDSTLDALSLKAGFLQNKTK